MISNVSNDSARIISLAVDSYVTGTAVFSNFSQVTVKDFHSIDVWQNFSVSFILNRSTGQMQFVGLSSTSAATIYFGGVT